MDAEPQNGGFLGYMVVRVDGSRIETEAVPAWNLDERIIAGGDGIADHAAIAIDNSTYDDQALGGVTVRMPAGRYTVSGAAEYKKKSKPVVVSIVSAEPSADGKTVVLTLSVEAPAARTVTVSVEPAMAGGLDKTKQTKL